jgi:hypothetical protein
MWAEPPKMWAEPPKMSAEPPKMCGAAFDMKRLRLPI